MLICCPQWRIPKAILVKSKYLKIKNFNPNAKWPPAGNNTYQASHGNVVNKYKLLPPTTTYNIVALQLFWCYICGKKRYLSPKRSPRYCETWFVVKLWHSLSTLLKVIIRKQETFLWVLPLLPPIGCHGHLRYWEVNKVSLGRSRSRNRSRLDRGCRWRDCM